MEDWKKYYRDHLVSMEEAAKAIKSGDTVWCGQTISTSYSFLNELNEVREGLKDVTLINNLSIGMFDMLFDESSKEHVHLFSLFAGPIDRMSGQMGISSFHSMPYEFAFRTIMDVYGATVEVTEVMPPDENGYINVGILGTGLDGEVHKDSRIKTRIAVVNKHQCPAPGKFEDINFHVSEFDYFVEDHHELFSLPVSGPTEIDIKIAEYILPYINDGDAVQIGMGGLGEQITKHLGTKKDMKVFSEIAVDSMMPLVESGAVTSLTCAGCFGSNELYHFLGTNEKVTMKNIWQMLDPVNISKTDNLVCINSTFMVDLTGQACSESHGVDQYSSVGGSFSYMYGCINSKGGRSFLCLRSTYKDDEGKAHSNIVPWLPEKSVVTAPRYLAMYIVSEHGVADVFLRTTKERIRAILKIAHPDFQEELKEQIISSGQITAEEIY